VGLLEHREVSMRPNKSEDTGQATKAKNACFIYEVKLLECRTFMDSKFILRTAKHKWKFFFLQILIDD
jgi:hypothetical protein